MDLKQQHESGLTFTREDFKIAAERIRGEVRPHVETMIAATAHIDRLTQEFEALTMRAEHEGAINALEAETALAGVRAIREQLKREGA